MCLCDSEMAALGVHQRQAIICTSVRARGQKEAHVQQPSCVSCVAQHHAEARSPPFIPRSHASRSITRTSESISRTMSGGREGRGVPNVSASLAGKPRPGACSCSCPLSRS